MLVAFSVAPAGGSPSDSVHDAVAAAVRVVRESGLPNRTDAMFTTIEGDWDECLGVVRAAVEAVEAYGTRVSLVLKADIRPGHSGELTGKLDRLEAAIARQDGADPAVETSMDDVPAGLGTAGAGIAGVGALAAGAGALATGLVAGEDATAESAAGDLDRGSAEAEESDSLPADGGGEELTSTADEVSLEAADLGSDSSASFEELDPRLEGAAAAGYAAAFASSDHQPDSGHAGLETDAAAAAEWADGAEMTGDLAEGAEGSAVAWESGDLTPEAEADAAGESGDAVEADDAAEVAASVTRPATVLARFVASAPLMTVQGSGEDDLPIRCASEARVLVADAAPPEQLGFVELSRAVLRTSGTVRIIADFEAKWSAEVGDSVSVVVWANEVVQPSGVWVEVTR